MKLYLEEPQSCSNCEGTEPMALTKASMDGKEMEGWICEDCGHFHVKDNSLYGLTKQV